MSIQTFDEALSEILADDEFDFETEEDMAKKETKIVNVEVIHAGTEIILPIIDEKPMEYNTAIEWLSRKRDEDNQVTSIHHAITCSPLDGAVAFQKALSKIYGWTQMVPTPGFFGDKPPTMVKIATGEDASVQVPLGRVEIPGITGYLETHVVKDSFVVTGEVKKKFTPQIKEITDLTEKFLREESIYRGNAIKVSWEWQRQGKNYHALNDCPKFMKLQGVKEDDLIFGEKVMAGLNIGLFTPIEQSEACRKHKIPLKRGVLLYGPYGTGKTMTANVTALKAVRNNWTFIYLESVRDLQEGLQFAAKYAPCVVFSEDVDRVITGERSLKMDDVLNIMDGVDTKGAEIITVFTTNHIEEINPAMLRMGRLDTLVEVTPPDAAAVQKLVTLYARGLLEPKASLKRIGDTLKGQIPAFVREVVERSKMAAIARLGVDIEGKVLEEDLIEAAHAMQVHADFLTPKEKEAGGNAEMFVKIPAGNKNAESILKSIKGGKAE